MLYLIVCCLAVALGWVWRRQRLLQRGICQLTQAMQQRTPFLHEDTRVLSANRAWAETVAETNRLINEVRQLQVQRVGQLSQLETTLGNLQEAVLIVDRDNYILLINNAFRKIFPGAQRALGQRIEVVLQSGAFLRYLEEVRTGPASPRKEIEFCFAGTSVQVEVTGSLVPDSRDQNGPWTLFVLHDVTRQKRLEELRKDFVANVSHELKTPLSVIKGYAETLADDYRVMNPADRDGFIKTILRHTNRLVAIVDDLLLLSRLESPTPALKTAPQNLVALLRAAADEFRIRLESTGHALSLAVESTEIAIDGDSLKLGQVVANLLENAQRHTPSGTQVELGARQEAGGGTVEVWVRDNGPGIPATDLPRIFERFYRVEKGRSREKGGTGLGLSIVKHIVQLHGGAVWAESRVGQGTRIAFRLPSRPAAATEAAMLDSSAPAL